MPIHFASRTEGKSKLSLKQQARYLRHLARLYRFSFPRTVLLGKAIMGAVAGWLLSQKTNPAMSVVLSVLSALTFVYATRQHRPAPVPSQRDLLAEECVLAHSDRRALEQAA